MEWPRVPTWGQIQFASECIPDTAVGHLLKLIEDKAHVLGPNWNTFPPISEGLLASRLVGGLASLCSLNRLDAKYSSGLLIGENVEKTVGTLPHIADSLPQFGE